MKRYDSYKDSGVEWIGEIPSHWDLERYKHLGDSSSTNISVNEFQNEEVIHYSIPNVQKKGTGVLEIGEDIDSSKLLLSGGELMISKLNPRKNCVCIVSQNHNYKILGSGEFVLLRPNGTNTKFLFYYLNNPSYTEYLDSSVESVTRSHQRVNPSIIYNSKVSLPPLSEQQQIVSFLDTKTSLIDSLIKKTQQKIELLKEKRTSLINEVVTKGLNPNVEMKDSGVEWIGEIPIHWGKIKLHTLVTSQKLEFQDGNHGGLHPIPEEFLEIGVPFIKPKDIQKEKVLWDSCDRLPFERCEQFRIGFSNNDDVLLVNRGGSIGKVVYVSDYDNEFPFFVINPQVTYLRGKNGLLSKYIFYISISDIFQCGIDLIMGHGSTFPFLGLSNMGDFEIVFPDISEQNEIVSYLDEQTGIIDKTISIEENRIELLKEYRQSLISEVVTGKRKVIE